MALIGTLPILIMLSLAMQLHGKVFRERVLQNTCRDRLLELQLHNAQGIESLLSLNRPLRVLKMELRVLEAQKLQAILTSNPVVAAAVSAKIQMVLAKLKVLQFRQAQLMTRGRLKASLSLNQLRQELSSKVRLMKTHTEVGRFDANLSIPSMHSWALDLIDPPFPEYYLKPEFEKSQSIMVHWRWTTQIKDSTLEVFRKNHSIPKSPTLRKDLICGATLIKTAAQSLQPKIHEDKF